MISYEQAYEVAKKNKPGIDFCTEMTDAYIFIEKEFADCEGGPGSPCVVLKENGKAINMPYYNGAHKTVKLKNPDLQGECGVTPVTPFLFASISSAE